MISLILFTTSAPHPFAEELRHQGFKIYEALAISEVYALIDQHLQLKPEVTVKDIVWNSPI